MNSQIAEAHAIPPDFIEAEAVDADRQAGSPAVARDEREEMPLPTEPHVIR